MKLNLFLTLLILVGSIFPLTGNTIIFRHDNIHVTTPSSDSLLISEVILKFSSDIDNFHRKIGQYPELLIRIRVIDDDDEYLSSARNSSEIIEFSKAFYSRREGTIYIRNPKEHRNFIYLNQILLHEYIHHFVSNYWQNTPLWFNEGMAVYFSGDLDMDREFNFVRNYILGNSSNLEQMKYQYPENRIEWESFYAKSGLAVKYLYKNNFSEFIDLCEYGSLRIKFESAFLHSFFMSTKDYSFLFEEYSKKHFISEILLASTGMIWGILPLILIIGWIRKKITAARIKKSWEIEDVTETEFSELEIENEEEQE